ncbi:MAG: NAD-dependent epimerase/dehydratase family protein [Candidatus Korobacteraceae bacterium]|jgi:CDP-paratose 2-epimerase
MANKVAFRSVLIFGGAGFIGSNWVRRLLQTTEAKIHVFDSLARPGSRYNLERLQKLAGRSGRLQFTLGDVRDQAKVERAVKHATEIYNFAAQVAVTTSIADPRLDFEVNVGGTINILEAARSSSNSPSLLFTSTNKVYGGFSNGLARVEGKRYVAPESAVGTSESQPLDFHSPYGCSKGAADQYVHDYARIYGLRTVVFRMSCIAGPGQFGTEDQGWVAHFLHSALLRTPLVIYGSGLQVRDVLHVEDLLDAFEAVHKCSAVTRGQVYNIGGGPRNTTSLLELVDAIAELTGIRLRYELETERSGDQLVYVTDHSKFTRDTGWTPRVGIPEILESLQTWFKLNRGKVASTKTSSLHPVLPPALAEMERSA